MPFPEAKVKRKASLIFKIYHFGNADRWSSSKLTDNVCLRMIEFKPFQPEGHWLNSSHHHPTSSLINFLSNKDHLLKLKCIFDSLSKEWTSKNDLRYLIDNLLDGNFERLEWEVTRAQKTNSISRETSLLSSCRSFVSQFRSRWK